MTDRVTVNFDDEVGEWITQQVENGEYESKSQCVEEVFLRGRDDAADLEDRVDELEDRLESREERIDQLESQLRKRSNIEEEIESVAERVEGLPARIEDTESYSERRQRKLDEATLTQRLKWRFTGVPVEDGRTE
jgi:predicted RNase H-like nuclease (RuvC/YqgF family)